MVPVPYKSLSYVFLSLLAFAALCVSVLLLGFGAGYLMERVAATGWATYTLFVGCLWGGIVLLAILTIKTLLQQLVGAADLHYTHACRILKLRGHFRRLAKYNR